MTQLQFLKKHFPKIAQEFEILRRVDTDQLSDGFAWCYSELGHSFWSKISSLVDIGINHGIESVKKKIEETCDAEGFSNLGR